MQDNVPGIKMGNPDCVGRLSPNAGMDHAKIADKPLNGAANILHHKADRVNATNLESGFRAGSHTFKRRAAPLKVVRCACLTLGLVTSSVRLRGSGGT